jgi:hypothetical protein
VENISDAYFYEMIAEVNPRHWESRREIIDVIEEGFKEAVLISDAFSHELFPLSIEEPPDIRQEIWNTLKTAASVQNT